MELGRADRDLRLAVTHDRDQPRAFRQPQLLDRLSGGGRALVDLHLDDLQVLLAQLEQVDEIVLRDLVLDEAEDARRRADRRRDAEQVEVRLVARVVDARDHLRDAVLLLRDLADDDVVLVVAGDRHHQVGPLHPGPLQHEQLGRIARTHDVLELLLEQPVAVAIALD